MPEMDSSNSSELVLHPGLGSSIDYKMEGHVIARKDDPEHNSHKRTVDETLHQMRCFIQEIFPGVLFSVGTLSLGRGSGAMTVSIQGEYVEKLKTIFPELAIFAFTQDGYNAARTPYVKNARAREQRAVVENTLAEKIPDALHVIQAVTSQNGDTTFTVTIQGEYVEETQRLLSGVTVVPFTREGYENALKPQPEPQLQH